jgi:hypothetical protein
MDGRRLRSNCAIRLRYGWSFGSSSLFFFACAGLHRTPSPDAASIRGADKIASVRDLDELVHAQTWHEDGSARGNVHKRTRWSPSCLRLDQVGEDSNTYVLYFDGSSGWEIVPDKSGGGLAGDELKFAEQYLQNLEFKLWLADRYPSPIPNVVRITGKKNLQSTVDVTLDSSSWLPIKQTVQHNETEFREWEKVEGIRYPHVTVLVRAGNAQPSQFTDSNWIVDSTDGNSLPPDSKPALGLSDR